MAGRCEGKVALVTGAASGIGAAVARLLADEGARVVVADIDEAGGQALAGGIGGLFVRTDVSCRADLTTAVSVATEAWERLDIVSLNAGVASGPAANGLAAVDPIDEEWYRRIVGINLDGVVFGVAAALPALRRSGGGSIVATASLAGLVPLPADPFYTMTKTAVVGLVRALAEPLMADRIRINALCPGFTDTPLIGGIRERFVAAGFPLLTAEDVARGFLTAAFDKGSGQAWFVQPGRDAAPYEFRGIPGPGTDGAVGVAPPPPLTGREARA